MKKTIFSILIGLLLISACDNNDSPTKDDLQTDNTKGSGALGCILGTITVFNTGNTTDALVIFRSYDTDAIVWSKKIDEKGIYETDKLFKAGDYYQQIVKIDYIDTLYFYSRKITVNPLTNGLCTNIDWHIEAEAKTLWIVDINSPEQRIDTLNFGSSETIKQFQIRNKGGIRFDWWIIKQNYDWIKDITYRGITTTEGTLKLNDYINLELEIDRSKLQENSVTFLIDSDYGGGRVLTVKVL
jgi:hypothetical protein